MIVPISCARRSCPQMRQRIRSTGPHCSNRGSGGASTAGASSVAAAAAGSGAPGAGVDIARRRRTSSSVTRRPALGITVRIDASRASLRVEGLAGTDPLRAEGSRRDGRSCGGWWSYARRWRRGGWQRPGGPGVRGGGLATRRIGSATPPRPSPSARAGVDLTTRAHREGSPQACQSPPPAGRVFLDHVAFADRNGGDLRFGQPFAQVRQDELAGH